MVIGLVGASTLPAAPRPGMTGLISRTADGGFPDVTSHFPFMSGDGRYVVFSTRSDEVVAGDANGFRDIFVHDRVAGVTELVSQASDGAQGDADSALGSISENGRFVAFSSSASNLVEDDTNEIHDVFVHDRVTGRTELVSVSSSGTQSNGHSTVPVLNDEGTVVVFESCGQNLVDGQTIRPGVCKLDIFRHDRRTGVTEWVSVAPGGMEVEHSSSQPCVDATGDIIAFESYGAFLPEDEGINSDVYVRDMARDTIERVSVGTAESEAAGPSHLTTISGRCLSADGRFVAFESAATNLVPQDTNWSYDVFVRDRQAGTTERISVSSSGVEGNSPGALPYRANSMAPAISRDGRWVVFPSASTTFAIGDSHPFWDIYIHDRLTHTTEWVSARNGDPPDETGASNYASVSADGAVVAFYSSSPDLVPGDDNGAGDIFSRFRGPAIGVGSLEATVQGSEIEVSGWAGLGGVTLASVTDPLDALAGPEAGAELRGAEVTQRPDQRDLLFRLVLEHLPGRGPGFPGSCTEALAPCLPSHTGAPGLVYGVTFTAGGVPYEIRASRGEAGEPSVEPVFLLYRCTLVCERVTRLSGGLGTAGDEVRISLPVASIAGAATLSSVRAFTAAGGVDTGGPAELDAVGIPDMDLEVASVALAVAPTDAMEEHVDFAVPAALTDGSFLGTIDTSELAPGDHDVWARVCLGAICHATSTPITI